MLMYSSITLRKMQVFFSKNKIWIVNAFLDNFYKDNPKRYATGVW